MTQDIEKPLVAVFSTGGTIAMTKAASGGVTPTLTGDNLLDSVPGIREIAAIQVDDFMRKPGASLTQSDLQSLLRALENSFADGAVGAVVTQGTDTIEETAYLLDLWHEGPQPIVITGAMRNPDQAGHDGPANLLAAVITAASSAAQERGVLAVMADEIHSARAVRKTHSTSVAAFSSPNSGPAGSVFEGDARFFCPPVHRLTVPLPSTASWPEVALVTTTLGDTGVGLEGLSAHLNGLVVAAMGVGHVPFAMVPVLESIASRIPVVLASRTGSGSVLTHTYGFPGSEADLIGRGLTPAGMLTPLKARLLLQAVLAAGGSAQDVADSFAAAGSAAEQNTWPWKTENTRPEREACTQAS